MHYFVWEGDEREIHVNHNGDFYGNVWLNTGDFVYSDNDLVDGNTVKVPFELMLEIVGRYFQMKAISAIEDQNGTEFMEGKVKA